TDCGRGIVIGLTIGGDGGEALAFRDQTFDGSGKRLNARERFATEHGVGEFDVESLFESKHDPDSCQRSKSGIVQVGVVAHFRHRREKTPILREDLSDPFYVHCLVLSLLRTPQRQQMARRLSGRITTQAWWISLTAAEEFT